MDLIDVQMKFILPEIRCLKDIKLTIRVDAVDNMLKITNFIDNTYFKLNLKLELFFDQRLINKKMLLIFIISVNFRDLFCTHKTSALNTFKKQNF